MLASAPPSTRVHTGGGISVCVNGTAVDSQKSVSEESAERLNGNVGSKDNAGNSSEWAKATITWCNGAQRISDGSANPVHNNNASSSVDINGPAPQLVHVIRVKPSDPGKEDMDSGGNGAPPVSKAQIRITSKPNGTYMNNNVGYCNKGKISVMVGSPINQVIKGEDERSSSGASSAPGSDSERSDSDREGDDGTDSGFCLSGRHCARVSVTANNNTNHSSIISDSLINESFDESPAKNVICNGNGNNVRLTIGSYSDKDSENKKVFANEDNYNMQFHLRELNITSKDKKTDSEDVQTKIASAHALLSGQGNDGAYNFKNKVRSSIVSLLVQSASNRNYVQEEQGRIVFYTTSMGVVRSTSERCRKVQKILETLMVRFDERDVFMNRVFQQELRERLGTNKITVPQIFIEGRHLGNAEVVEQLNEIGELREILRPYKRQSIGGVCELCGGYKYLLCPECGGSKKSVTHRHQFSEDVVALRCVSCDEGGLIRCVRCMGGED